MNPLVRSVLSSNQRIPADFPNVLRPFCIGQSHLRAFHSIHLRSVQLFRSMSDIGWTFGKIVKV